jgi:hypothetical protein
MGKECFTCAHKISRELSKEERKQLSDDYFKEHGRHTLLIPEMEFTCSVSGKKISQIDPACEHYSGDSFMESVRKDIAKTARKLREELNG